MIEKLLKALYVKQKGEYPPLIHDLRRICEKAGVELDMVSKINFDSISRFNINARYDDYKQSFYLLCTESFTEEWIEKIKTSRFSVKKYLFNKIQSKNRIQNSFTYMLIHVLTSHTHKYLQYNTSLTK